MQVAMHVTFPIGIPLECPFPLSNIPFGIFNTRKSPTRRVGTAIGQYILDLSQLERRGLFTSCFAPRYSATSSSEDSSCPKDGRGWDLLIFEQFTLNAFAAMPASKRTAVRTKIINLLSDQESILFKDQEVNKLAFYKLEDAEMHLPMRIGDFSDFMCARTHVDNCSKMAGAPGIPPNFYAFPTAYNGHASSVVVSGTSIHRPKGMLRSSGDLSSFEFGPSKRMDYELELGFFVSNWLPFGKVIKTADEAKEYIFGFVMLNDWSARDIQFAEMTPLGPFNGKGSGTSISPWVVTLDALEGAEIETSDEVALGRMGTNPPHLRHDGSEQTWNIEVEASLRRGQHEKPVVVSASNLKELFWSPAQMLSHHASSGCGLRTGDLLGTGTVSSSQSIVDGASGLGCLHEINEAGTVLHPLKIGDSLVWLEDGDEVVMTGKVKRSDGSWVGFGECTGRLEPCVEE